MKKSLVWLCGTLLLLMLSVSANAELIKIGTAQFGGEGDHYNLIWDGDNNGNSVVWLDYSNSGASWIDQKNWADTLNLTYDWVDGFTVDWDTNPWRLPNAVSSYGYGLIQSEMGHLFYEELENSGLYADGNLQIEYGLKNTGVFEQLTEAWYWTGSDANNQYTQTAAWDFSMAIGAQDRHNQSHPSLGLAIRTGTVSITTQDPQPSPIPEPTTMILFSVGLLGIAGVSRRKK